MFTRLLWEAISVDWSDKSTKIDFREASFELDMKVTKGESMMITDT
jgi:hypothetical protein